MPYKDREQQLEARRRFSDKRRRALDALKDVPCADCGGKFPPCVMDFDHVRGTKFKGVSKMYTHSMDAVLKEIEKCDIVCANCHRIRTNSRL